MGGVMMYKINDPKAPVFVDYVNTSNFAEGTGDISPEGLTFISKDNNPSGKNLLVVGYEVSGSVAIFSVGEITGFDENQQGNASKLLIYPNPSNGGEVFLNKKSDISIYTISGQLVKQLSNVSTINISDLKSGIYLISDNEGKISKFLKSN
jgi:hypothetical protein